MRCRVALGLGYSIVCDFLSKQTIVRCRVDRRLLAAAVIALSVVIATPARAHNPHDPVLALGVSPSYANDHTLFVATFGEMNWSYKELLRSTDGGQKWTKVPTGMDNRSDFSTIRVSPSFAADGTVYAATRGDGVYRSTNRGDSWTLINAGMANTSIKELKLGGAAGTDYTLFAAPSNGGLLRRASSQAAWTVSLATTIGVNALATSPDFTQDGIVMTADTSGRLRVSNNGGATWADYGTPVAATVHDIAIAPGRAKEVFMATSRNGVYYSNDGGKTFVGKLTGLPAEAINNIAVSPNYLSDHTVFCTSITQSVYRSVDGGGSWTLYPSKAKVTRQTTALNEFSELQVSNTFASDRAVFLSAFDGLFASVNAGAAWSQLETRKRVATGVAFSPNFAADRRVMATVYSERGLYSSVNAGTSWSLAWNGWPHPGDSLSIFDIDFVKNHPGAPLAVATRNHSNIGFTSDFGATWNVLALPRLPVTKPSDVYVTSLGLSPAFDTDREIYLGSRAHGLLQTLDGGATWRRTANGPSGQITSIAVSPNYAADHTVFVGSVNGGVWRSRDGGDTWTRVGATSLKMRGGLHYTWVAVSPTFAVDRLVLVGTNNGIYRSLDGGTTWQPIGRAEVGTATVVHQIEFSPDFAADRTIFAVVRGRGMYRATLSSTGTVGAITNVGSSLLSRNVEFTDFRLSPAYASDGTLLGVSGEEAYRSIDRGTTWDQVGTPAGSL